MYLPGGRLARVPESGTPRGPALSEGFVKTSNRLLGLLGLALVAPAAHAGGVYLWEIGTATMGTAGAGWAAMPEEPFTAFTNPAGTVWRKETEILAAGQLLYGDLGFDRGPQTNVSGGDGGNPVGWIPNAGFHAAGLLAENVGWGFSAAGNFGGLLEYDSRWAGRRFAQTSDLLGLNLVPSLSWRVTPELSFGLALNVMWGFYEFKSAPRAGLTGGNAFLKYEDTDTGFGGNLGVIYRPSPGTTLGLVYTSKVALDFSDRLKLRNFGPLFNELVGRLDGARTEIDMNVPATVTASLQQKLSPATTLYANLNWQDWSDFGKVGLEIGNPAQASATVNRLYENTWHAALGVRHRYERGALAGWSLSTGIAYDSSAVDEEDLTADFVVGKQWRLGLGARRELCPGAVMDLGFTLVWTGDLDIDQRGIGQLNPPRLQGTYENTALYVFGGSVTWDL